MEPNNSNNNSHTTGNSDEPVTNLHAHVAPTPENPHGYLPFDMCLVLNYTNNQITYYYTTGAISATDQSCFHQLMKQ